jgi:uncharacterized FAD-dependent dehydrogenase
LRDVLIVGAGPAGLFAAKTLAEAGLSVLVVDAGEPIEGRSCPAVERGRCQRCTPCRVMCGIGGAGGMSSGTLNLSPQVGGELSRLAGGERRAWELIGEVDGTFLRHGAPQELKEVGGKGVKWLEEKARRAGIRFIPIRQRHIGSELLPGVVGSFVRELAGRGVVFLPRLRVERVGRGWVSAGGRRLGAKYLLLAPGRFGAEWLLSQAQALGMRYEYGPIDIGVRVETPARVLEPAVRVSWDPKFHILTDTFRDFVRTFCCNYRGFVLEERYGDFAGVNGQSLRARKSNNANFALLVRVELTHPVTNTLAYGSSIARLATAIGGGFPLLQRLGDLRRGRRSTWERIRSGGLKPTLLSVTPGDISMALPGRMVTDLVEALEKLDRVLPGVASDRTLLYAPELKLYALRVVVDENMQTSVPGIFVAGDGAGLSRGIVGAAATGILAARGILRKEGAE